MSENLVLEHLRAIRVDIRDIRETQRGHTRQLGRIELELAGLRHQAALDAEARAELGLRVDGLSDRVDRIERRLELSDGPVS
jgi:hypothetical protein